MSHDFNEFTTRLDKAIDHIKSDIASLRTGRASVQLLDSVRVEAYSTSMKINEVANISTPDSSLLVVTPWDKSLIEAVQKGIAAAGLNLNPVVDGDLIRISIPPLTEERRKEMVKSLGQKVEQGKVMLRNIRNDEKKEVENLEGSEGMSEDDIKFLLEEMEKIFHQKLDLLEKISQDKEKELMTF